MIEYLETWKLNRRRALRLAAGSAAGAALLSAFGTVATARADATAANLYLALISDAMTGKENWPVYVPTEVVVPANSAVNVQIAQFDAGAGELPDDSPFAAVTGIIDGTLTAAPIAVDNPNTRGDPITYQALAPADVSHTFTIGALGVNVPLPATAVVSFTFLTGAPGRYTFQCMVPCGTDPDGVGGAMAQEGYMVGTLRVV